MPLQNKAFTIFCGSSLGSDPDLARTAKDLATQLAKAGAKLVYGGASVGLMGVLADSALAAGGQVIGVIPETLVAKEIAHKGLTELLVVGTMNERKRLMFERADGFITLPGGYGTLDELFEVVTEKQLGFHTKPIIILNLHGFYDALLTQIDRAISSGLVRAGCRDYITVVSTVEDVLSKLANYVPPTTDQGKWQ